MGNTPTLCLYHGNCTDGFSAAWAVWRRFGDTVQYHAALYGIALPDVTGHHVLMVDYSCPKPVLVDMAQKAKSITIVDHHKTAQKDLADFTVDYKLNCDTTLYNPKINSVKPSNIRAVFDMNKSGAVMAWEYCHPETDTPDLLYHVQDRDLWQFKLPNTREIIAYLNSYDFDFKQWSSLAKLCALQSGKSNMIAQGSAIERRYRKDLREALNLTKRTMVIGGVTVPAANVPYAMASDAGELMSADAPFAVCYYDRADARIFSLRSRKDGGTDVSQIAALYGGGGHKEASGFQAIHGWEGDRV